jgi:hypothetical protein
VSARRCASIFSMNMRMHVGKLARGLVIAVAIAVSGCVITSDGLELEPIDSGQHVESIVRQSSQMTRE